MVEMESWVEDRMAATVALIAGPTPPTGAQSRSLRVPMSGERIVNVHNADV